jgi:hypothetical protein
MIFDLFKGYITVHNLIIINSVFFCILLFVKYIQNIFYPRNFPQDSKKAFLQFLDKFYIKNKVLNLICVLFFIITYFGVMFILRMLYLGYSKELEFFNLSDLDFSWSNFCYILLFFSLYVMAFVLFFSCLKAIFYTEVLKFYLYYSRHFLFFYNIRYYIVSFYTRDFIGPVYFFFESIHRKYDNSSIKQATLYAEYQNFIEKTFIISLLKKGIFYTTKFKVLHYINFIFYCFFYICYKHLVLYGFFSYLHYFILGISVYIDLIFLKCFYYTYYALFFSYMYNIVLRWLKFETRSFATYNTDIYKYFYKNKVSYQDQRYWLFSKKDIILPDSFENQKIYSNIKTINFVHYVFNSLEKKNSDNEIRKRLNQMYLRFFTLLFLSILSINALYYKKQIIQYIIYDISFIILIFVLILYLLHKRSFYLPANKKEEAYIGDFTDYVYNSTFHRIFWIITLILCYILWLLVFKENFLSFDTEVLWSSNYIDLRIIRCYTLKEKMMLCEEYFNQCLDKRLFSVTEKIMFFEYLNAIDFNQLITEEIQLKRCKQIIQDFCDNYLYIHNLYVTFIK